MPRRRLDTGLQYRNPGYVGLAIPWVQVSRDVMASKHDRAAQRIARKLGTEYNRGRGAGVIADDGVIEVETVRTVNARRGSSEATSGRCTSLVSIRLPSLRLSMPPAGRPSAPSVLMAGSYESRRGGGRGST
jgi:hypothetical protein